MIDAGANRINAETITAPGGYIDATIIDHAAQFGHCSYPLDDVMTLLLKVAAIHL
jgi:hypothetical protein